MDHHCPWLNTCVSFANYKFFVLVLFYGALLCLFTFASILPFYTVFFFGDNTLGGNVEASVYTRFTVLFLFFVSGMFLMPVAGMIYDHAFMLAKNKTTIGEFFTIFLIENLLASKMLTNFERRIMSILCCPDMVLSNI